MGYDPSGAFDMSPGAQAAYDAWLLAEQQRQQSENNMSPGARAARDWHFTVGLGTAWVTLGTGVTMRVTASLGKTYDLGGGWTARLEKGLGSGKDYHMHVDRGGTHYAQNNDGTGHDGSSGNPPGWVQKGLKKQTGWDWGTVDANKVMRYFDPDTGISYYYDIEWGRYRSTTDSGIIPFSVSPTWGIPTPDMPFVPIPVPVG